MGFADAQPHPTAYIEGMHEFRDVTYPLLKQAGLRD